MACGWHVQARLEGCSCERGCLSCVHMAGCGEYNEGLEKPAARVILRWLLQGETPPSPAPAEEEREEAHALEDATAGAKGDGGQAPAEEQAGPGQIAGGDVGAAELVAPGAKRSKCSC